MKKLGFFLTVINFIKSFIEVKIIIINKFTELFFCIKIKMFSKILINFNFIKQKRLK